MHTALSQGHWAGFAGKPAAAHTKYSGSKTPAPQLPLAGSPPHLGVVCCARPLGTHAVAGLAGVAATGVLDARGGRLTLRTGSCAATGPAAGVAAAWASPLEPARLMARMPCCTPLQSSSVATAMQVHWKVSNKSCRAQQPEGEMAAGKESGRQIGRMQDTSWHASSGKGATTQLPPGGFAF